MCRRVTDNDEVSEQDPQDDRAVANGLVALVAVALGVGLILALVALMGTKVLGVGDDGGSADAADSGGSMYLPTPSETIDARGPQITLATEDPEETESSSASSDASESESETASESASESKSAKEGEISLQAAENEIEAGEKIYFSGVYPDGEGAILWVQRWEDGKFRDFPASFTVTNGTFSSYIFTGQTGLNRLRVINKEDGTVSNEIRVRVGDD